MNIKKQLLESIKNNGQFAFSSSAYIQREKFLKLAKKFLDSRTYGESERYGRNLMNFILFQHDKSSTVGPALDVLNNFELYEKYDYKKQRLHFTHQANVFLLGLYLYHKIPFIKKQLDEEMELTTEDFEITVNGFKENLRYSGRSKYGEFLFRWRLASLSHDLGYGISLAGNNKKMVEMYLDDISAFLIDDLKNLEDIWHFNGMNLLDQLDDKLPKLSLKDYMFYQEKNPFKDKVHYDHGLISSLIFLRLMNEVYKRHQEIPFSSVYSTRIFWHESFLNGSIQYIAIAIALHNLNQYEPALKQAISNGILFNFNENTLAWLLKISDILQEWDKPIACEDIMNKKIEPVDMNILYDGKQIIINNFPKNKIDEIKATINCYTHPKNLIKIE